MKVVYVSSMLPSGHFSQILTTGITTHRKIKLIVYADKNPKNLDIQNCGNIKTVWKKNYRYIFDILRQIRKDKPEIVHIQQEFSMYGSVLTALLFPLLPFILKMLGFRTIVTIHAAVYKKQINNKFISLFTTRSFFINTKTLKIFFLYTYKLTSIFAFRIVCHTNLMKDILTNDYFVNPDKVIVIPTPVPLKYIKNMKKENYFFYFGYMVRRKGLEYVLSGFRKFVRKYKKYTLVLAGDVIKGQEYALEEIKRIIHRYALSKKVIIKGFVEDEDLDELYGRAAAVVIPARVSMGSSGPLYHAQSYGKCILVSNVGHFKEDVKDLYDGMLVNNSRWHEAFEFVVNNPKIVSNIERNVVIKARNKSAPNIGGIYSRLYDQILKEV